jgi:hypothetical protein
MQINHPDTAPDWFTQAGRLRTGDEPRSVLLSGIEDAPDDYRLTFSSPASPRPDGGDGVQPRHRHCFDQIRYVLTGEYTVGPDKEILPGQLAYHPEGAFYGPVVAGPGLEMLVLQFGGASGLGFVSTAARKKGLELLIEEGGRLEGGMYVYEDENGKRHNQDAFEAMWEHLYGKKMTYPPARFDAPIVMDPANFSWTADPDNPGVATKMLAAFTERTIRVGFIALQKGATLGFGTEPSAEIAFVTRGSIIHDGTIHPRLTAFGTTATETPGTLLAAEDAELFYVKLPTF